MPQILRIRTVACPWRTSSFKRFTRILHEVHELVDFQECHEWIEQASQVLVHQDWPACRSASCVILGTSLERLGLPSTEPLPGSNSTTSTSLQLAQCRFDAWAHVGPAQSAEVSGERRNGNRPDVEFLDHTDEIDESGVDVLDSALAAPVTLRREVDDVPWIRQRRLVHGRTCGQA